jgi:hypothetical protein
MDQNQNRTECKFTFCRICSSLAIGLFLHDEKQNTAKKDVYSVHLIDTNKKTMCAIQTLKFMSNVYLQLSINNNRRVIHYIGAKSILTPKW